MTSLDEYYTLRHKRIMLPCVRIRTPKAGGSGTVLYSEKNGDGGYSSYVLTNHHVVENCIKIEPEWSSLLKAERKTDKFEQVAAHFFRYQWQSRATGGITEQCDIVGYDKNEDLALLKLRSAEPAPAVAKLFPRGKEGWLRIGMPVVTVGAGLGEPPLQTGGFLSQFGREIDRREFWLNTAPSIFGNSGGAMFLGDLIGFHDDLLAKEYSYNLIGVPARIAIAVVGWGNADPVTHLSFAIPVTRIYTFLEEQRFRFIYDPENFTEKEEEEERQRLREEQLARELGKR